MNQVVLIGNITADPSVKVAQNGNKVCTMRLAVNSGWGDNKRTDFLHLVAFGKRADSQAQVKPLSEEKLTTKYPWHL